MTNKVELVVNGEVQQTLDIGFVLENLSVGRHDITIKSYNNDTLLDEQTRTVEIFQGGEVSTEGLIADFDFNTTEGDLVENVQGSTYSVPPTVVRTGEHFEFKNEGDVITIPHEDRFSLVGENEESIPFTIRIIGGFYNSNPSILEKVGGTINGMHEYRLAYKSDKFEWSMYDDTASSGKWYSTSYAPESNTNQEVERVVTYDGKGTVKIYSNGQRIDNNGGGGLESGKFQKMYVTDAPLVFGNINNREIHLKKLQFYKGVEWTPTEVANAYNN